MEKNIKYLLIKLIFSFMLISIVFAAPETTDSAIQEDNAVESIPDSENNEISTPLESENTDS